MPPSPGMDPELTSGGYYQQPASDIAGGLPINLDSLRDGPPGSKPFYPYSTLIRYAIKGSPNHKLLLEDIYYAIESRFPYFRTAPAGWKNSVRHNLSLNPCFVKVARPLTDRGKGSYWTVDDNVDPRTGVHRVRKRRGKNSGGGGGGGGVAAPSSSADADADYHPPGDVPAEGYPETIRPYTFGEEDFAPEVDEAGQPIWRNMWVNELIRLRAWTAEHEKAGADPEWYKIMLMRIRHALHSLVPDPSTMGQGVLPEGHDQAQ